MEPEWPRKEHLIRRQPGPLCCATRLSWQSKKIGQECVKIYEFAKAVFRVFRNFVPAKSKANNMYAETQRIKKKIFKTKLEIINFTPPRRRLFFGQCPTSRIKSSQIVRFFRQFCVILRP